jgi:hypothetical protein
MWSTAGLRINLWIATQSSLRVQLTAGCGGTQTRNMIEQAILTEYEKIVGERENQEATAK